MDGNGCVMRTRFARNWWQYWIGAVSNCHEVPTINGMSRTTPPPPPPRETRTMESRKSDCSFLISRLTTSAWPTIRGDQGHFMLRVRIKTTQSEVSRAISCGHLAHRRVIVVKQRREGLESPAAEDLPGRNALHDKRITRQNAHQEKAV